jgi:hypothetical protein
MSLARRPKDRAKESLTHTNLGCVDHQYSAISTVGRRDSRATTLEGNSSRQPSSDGDLESLMDYAGIALRVLVILFAAAYIAGTEHARSQEGAAMSCFARRFRCATHAPIRHTAREGHVHARYKSPTKSPHIGPLPQVTISLHSSHRISAQERRSGCHKERST